MKSRTGQGAWGHLTSNSSLNYGKKGFERIKTKSLLNTKRGHDKSIVDLEEAEVRKMIAESKGNLNTDNDTTVKKLVIQTKKRPMTGKITH